MDDSGVYTFTIRNRLGVKQIETKIYVQPHANNDNQNNLSRLTEEPTNYNSEVIEEVVYDEVEETVEDLTEGLCHRNLVERQKQHDQEIENQRLQELERQKEIERNERIQREEHEKELQRQRHQEEIERREHEQKLEKERRARVDEERRLQTERVERQKELQRQRELEKAERERKELENQQRIERERMELERQLREQEQIEQQQREQEQREQQQREQQQREQQQQANRQRAVQKLPDLFPNKNKSQTVPTNIESIENLLPARPTDKIIKSAKISKVEEIQKQLHAENNNDLRHIPEDEALEEENLFDASVDDRVHTPEQPLQSPNSPIRQESQQKDSAISVNRSIESIKQQFNSPRQTEIPASISPPQDISPNKHSSAPNILQGLEDQSVPDSCTTFQWELIIESNPMPELTWFLNGEKITINGTEDEPFETFCEGLPDQSNAYRFIFKLKEVFPEDAGFWMVFVENEHGKAKSKASLHVNNVQGYGPSISNRCQDNYLVEIGQPLNIIFKVDGEPVPNLTYSINEREHQPAHMLSDRYLESDIEMDDGIEFTLAIHEIRQEDLGDWSISIKNYHGEIFVYFQILLSQNQYANYDQPPRVPHPVMLENQQPVIQEPEEHQQPESVTATPDNDETETVDDSLADKLANISMRRKEHGNNVAVVNPIFEEQPIPISDNYQDHNPMSYQDNLSEADIPNSQGSNLHLQEQIDPDQPYEHPEHIEQIHHHNKSNNNNHHPNADSRANKTKINLMDMMGEITDTETDVKSNSSEETIGNENTHANEAHGISLDVRNQATQQLDQNAQLNEEGQLDFRNVLHKTAKAHEPEKLQPPMDRDREDSNNTNSSSNNIHQMDFRGNLRSNSPQRRPPQNLERPVDHKVEQLDFRSMLKNKTNTKTLSEADKRRQQAEQFDFRNQIGKK